MRTVHEVSELTGVSVRTLHHYDAIGLLKPTKTTAAGYRLYDNTAMARLQTILLFRELNFPLKEIKRIIDNPDFDCKAALAQQVELLELQPNRLSEIIAFAREIIKTGVNNMNFKAFDKTEIEKFSEEAKKKWGGTAEYKEFEQKTASKTSADMEESTDGLMQIFADVSKIKHLSPDSAEAQDAVKNLQQYITEHFYNCTTQILSGLGQMYVGDERFQTNIDSIGGKGTAEYAAKAIEIYCKNSSI